MIIRVHSVPEKFAVIWFTVQGRKHRFLNRTQSIYEFADEEVETQVLECYEFFVRSNKSIDDFFDRDVIECSKSPRSQRFTTSVKKVSRVPVFIGKRTSPAETYYFIPLMELLTKCPIEMTEEQIVKMWNIHDTFDYLTELYERHSINFKYVEVRANKCHISDDLPGQRQGDHKTIVIGKSKDRKKTFWVADTYLIIERLYCTKFPGKCLYWSEKSNHLQRHMDSCVDEPQIISNQVGV